MKSVDHWEIEELLVDIYLWFFSCWSVRILSQSAATERQFVNSAVTRQNDGGDLLKTDVKLLSSLLPYNKMKLSSERDAQLRKCKANLSDGDHKTVYLDARAFYQELQHDHIVVKSIQCFNPVVRVLAFRHCTCIPRFMVIYLMNGEPISVKLKYLLIHLFT